MLRTALLLAIVLPLAGCQLAVPMAATQVAFPLATSQTVLRGTKQMVEIRTEPPGATVSIAGYETRTTPTFIMLARGHPHTVRIFKDGFKPYTMDLASQRASVEGGASNTLGGMLDEASGAAWELSPSRLTVKLESTETVATTPAASTTDKAVAGAPVGPTADPARPKATPAATPPIAAKPQPPAEMEPSAVLAEQIARIDRLLEQGIITQREHEILTAAAVSAAALAGVTPAQ